MVEGGLISNLAPEPLAADKLRSPCRAELLGFKSTSELEPVDALIGQERALNAMHFGTEIKRPGYNLFALGPQGTGRHTAITGYLRQKASKEVAADDWVYVSNLVSGHYPLALRLPPGLAVPFRDSMDELVEDLKRAIPAVFQSDEYREKKRLIDTEFEETQEKSFDLLRDKARQKNIAIMNTPMGFALAPLKGDEVINPDEFNAMPKNKREAIEADIGGLQSELAKILEQVPIVAKQHRERIQKLNAELTGKVVDASIKSAADKFVDIEVVQNRLQLIREDLVRNLELFLSQQSNEIAASFPVDNLSQIEDPRLNRYRVNVMVANDGDGDHKGAPFEVEEHPTLANLVGRIEHRSQFGALLTDFMMIRPGALHKANGGYLVLDARKVLTEPFSWEALKRALISKTIRTISGAEELSLVSTVSLEPEPIPLDVKVVLIGERLLYYLLCELDPEFSDLFKVQVDFDEQLIRSDENVQLYARLIATIVSKESLLPLTVEGVARVIEEVSRYADDAERLTLNIRQLADLLREADFWAQKSDKEHIGEPEIDRAIAEQITRASRIYERSLESIDRDIMLIKTSGDVVGQINGLAVSQLGNFSFGRPTRITARVRMGAGKVVDIERETKLGGPLHSKGVLILSGFLAANYALEMPMSLWASIVFEQSYGGIDGDSASSAELYALLSALADVPINQSLAVTGSVNQMGDVQAIGGVNEKIEGFFDVCSARGLTGSQGVLIPAANVQHLMLRLDVVKACQQGQFKIHPIEHVAQGIELLTGITAGARQNDNEYPEESINFRVEAKLLSFARSRQAFSDSSSEGSEEAVAK